MCGISGYISPYKLEDKLFQESLHHRGPDDQGSYSASIHRSNIFLSHNRLSIIDLSKEGAQPMFTSDKKISLIYNGEIYNYKQLQNQYLINKKLHSKTDTEVLLSLYELFGIDSIKKLNGDFAFAILDQNNKKLFLVRDRLGVKPLYYYHKDDKFIFASELKTIIKSLSLNKVSDDALQRYFVFKYVPGNDTLFEDIKRLEPGCYIEFDLLSLKFKIIKYWELFKNEEIQKLSFTEAKSELFNLLNDSINMQLMSDVPVGTFFSGGLDSSTIAFFLKEKKEITHYTARKSLVDLHKEGSSSDYFFADKLAKQWNLNLISIDIGFDELELIKKILYYSDDLIADGSLIPTYIISEKASHTSKVLLSGMGADELFLGYAGHQITLLSAYLDKTPAAFSKFITGLFSNYHVGSGYLKPYKRFLNKLGKYYNYGNLRYGLMNIVGDYENSASVYLNNVESSSDYIRNYFLHNDDLFDAVNKFEMNNFLVKNLHYIDRMCMANSVEGRVPFLDYRFVEFAYSLPRSYKLSGFGNTKKILKDTMKPNLPGFIINRRKAGFGMPLRSIFNNVNNIYKIIDLDFFSQYKGFSLPAIKKNIGNHLNRTEDNSALIYSLISFQEWFKVFHGYISV
jgi:asparagine synthase (glutamine-hydrolysing)